MDCDDIFPTGPLSFDSNLDSIIDADFNDDLERPFPSQYPTSAHLNERAELIVPEGVGVVETANDLTESDDAHEKMPVNGVPMEENQHVSHSESAYAGSLISDSDKNRKVSDIHDKKEGKTIGSIEHLNLMKIKEKRQRKLAESKNKLKSAKCKENSEDREKLPSMTKKRKHEDSFQTSIETVKKLKETKEVKDNTIEKFVPETLGDEGLVNHEKKERSRPASIAADKEVCASHHIGINETQVKHPLLKPNKGSRETPGIPYMNIQEKNITNANSHDTDIKTKNDTVVKENGVLSMDEKQEMESIDVDKQEGTCQWKNDASIDEQKEKTVNKHLEIDFVGKGQEAQNLVIQKNIDTDINEQKEIVISDNKTADIYQDQEAVILKQQKTNTCCKNERGFDEEQIPTKVWDKTESGCEVVSDADIVSDCETLSDGEIISERESVSEAEILSEAEITSEGEIVSEAEITSEGEIVSEAEITSEGEIVSEARDGGSISEGEVNSKKEFTTDIDDELDIPDISNNETETSDIHDTTLVDTDQTTLTETGQENDTENNDTDKAAVEDSADNVDNDFDNDDDDDDDADDESDDFDDNDVDAWLEEGIEKETEKEKSDPSEVTCETELGDGKYIEREKHILQEKGSNPFDVLPEDWVMVMHNSGMPVYLHKPTRVCTMSRPYFIGEGSVRKHDIPLSAVPCLQYRRQLEKEAKQVSTESSNEAKDPIEVSTDIPTPVIAEAVQKDLIGAPELYDYCKSLFEFKSVVVKKFLTWREKRSHLKEKQEQQKKQLPKMSADTKLIVCPIPEAVAKLSSRRKKEFLINPDGKSAICILHEYTQHVLKVQPVYNFSEIENNVTPYKATIKIDGIGYGSGVGRCKRQAKAEAAKQALIVFIPKLAEHWKDIENRGPSSDLAFFEDIAIEDPRVPELCEKAALPKPFQVLTECLRRNYGMGDTNLQVEKKMISSQKTEFSLTVGKHTATVVCKNKIVGKQKAAQAMLQKLHPQLKNWAAILQLYSKRTEVGFQERQDDETPQQAPKKDIELLDKLKQAMRKSRNQQGKRNASNFCTLASQHLDL